MDIKRVGSQASGKGPAEWFTGTVRVDPLFQAPDPAFVQGASVTFRTGCADGMAHPSPGADFDCDRWLRLGTALGRSD
jgi:hypothetical protein